MKKIIPILLVICATVFGATESDMDRLFDEAVANAKTPKQKTLALFEQRIHTLAKKKAGVEEIFQPKDGVDQFEAFVLSHAYFATNFGACGALELPEKKGDFWFVEMVVGSAAEQLPSAVIDSRTGKLTCAGHPSVTDALAYLKEFMTPNSARSDSPKRESGRGLNKPGND